MLVFVVWRAFNAHRVRRMLGHGSRTADLCTHPHLPLVAITNYEDIQVWDINSRSLFRVYGEESESVYCLAFDPSGRRLASGTGFSVKVWDLDSGACVRALSASIGCMRGLVWNAAGALFATRSKDITVRLWDATSGALRHTLKGHSNYVNALAAHPADDLLASASDDHTVRVWRWSSGAHANTLEGHLSSVFSLVASASWLVSGSGDTTIRVWSWTSRACVRVINGFSWDANSIRLAWRGSTLVTRNFFYFGGVRIWDTSAADPKRWVDAWDSDLLDVGDSAVVLHDERIVCDAPEHLNWIGVQDVW